MSGNSWQLLNHAPQGVWNILSRKAERKRIMHATIIMEGRLVTDPEIKSGKNGDYCTFRFVVNTKYGNQDNASFFNCTASEYIANRMQKAGIKKGRLIEIIGNLNLRPYETDEGIRQISADVSVLEWHFTGSKPKGDEADSSQGTTKTAQKSTGKVRPEQTIPSGDDDDDLPL